MLARLSLLVALCLTLAGISPVAAGTLKQEQLRFPRVRAAYDSRLDVAKRLFEAKQLSWPPPPVFWRAFKQDKSLELWALNRETGKYVLVKEYEVCRLSGTMGPKRREGDYQIPEGFYEFTEFNPASSYHLSLRINYPNSSDRILGDRKKLGGDIFVHGDCVTIGCLPMTDEQIDEIYLITLEARGAGQAHIPIHVFPTRLAGPSWEKLLEEAGSFSLWHVAQRIRGARPRSAEELRTFWKNLKVGYDYFEASKTLPKISVGEDGRYRFE